MLASRRRRAPATECQGPRSGTSDAQTLGVRKTPGFFVDCRPLEPFGAEPLVALVEAAVRERYPG